MLTLQHGKNKVILPSCWEELSARQMVFAIRCLSTYQAIPAQLRIIYAMLPLRWKYIFKKLSDIELHALRLEFAFLQEEPVFDKWVFPKLWIGLRVYHGPGDVLAKLNVRQFARANFYLNKFSQNEDPVSLNKFMASIYLPKNGKFSDEYLQKTFGKMGSIGSDKKKAIAVNFVALRTHLLSKCKDAFSKSDKQSRADKYGWDGMVLYIAANRHMATDAIYNMKLSEFLIQMDVTSIINKEAQQEKP
jgi:hypothetical protein